MIRLISKLAVLTALVTLAEIIPPSIFAAEVSHSTWIIKCVVTTTSRTEPSHAGEEPMSKPFVAEYYYVLDPDIPKLYLYSATNKSLTDMMNYYHRSPDGSDSRYSVNITDRAIAIHHLARSPRDASGFEPSGDGDTVIDRRTFAYHGTSKLIGGSFRFDWTADGRCHNIAPLPLEPTSVANIAPPPTRVPQKGPPFSGAFSGNAGQAAPAARPFSEPKHTHTLENLLRGRQRGTQQEERYVANAIKEGFKAQTITSPSAVSKKLDSIENDLRELER